MKYKILALGGSSSRNSINRKLARYVATLVSDASVMDIDLNDFEMPLYSIDRQNADGFPEPSERFASLIGASDAVVLSLAEHNHSYTAAFKNLIDWTSRVDRKYWQEKPMLLLSTSPGGRGGANVLDAALRAFPFAGAQIVGSYALPSFFDNFQDGKIIYGEHKDAIDTLVGVLEKRLGQVGQ